MEINKNYGEAPAKLPEEIPWNKLCLYLIGPYKILIKGRSPIILNCVTIIYPVNGWFEITKYNNKNAMKIENLVETTCLVRYSWPVEIMYDRGGELLGHKLKVS